MILLKLIKVFKWKVVMFNKNNDNEAPKNTIPNDMKLDDDMIHRI